MAPILIDIRELIKLGILSVLTIVLAFTGGYQFGHQQANRSSDFAAAAVIEQSFPRPEESAAPVKEIAQQTLEVSHESNNNDVAQTESVVPVTYVMVKVAEVKPKSVASKKVPEKLVPKVTEPRVTTVKEKDPVEKKPAVSTATLAAPENNDRIKYSIQVAVYGRMENAENMMNMLQAEKLDAYISDYINKKDKVRFNVRFGHFKDKKSALSALQDYIDNQKGDGYLVNYSAKNIVDVAQVKAVVEEPVDAQEEVKQPVTDARADNDSATVSIPVSVSEPIPESTSVDNILDNVSQAEDSDTSIDLKTAQGNARVN